MNDLQRQAAIEAAKRGIVGNRDHRSYAPHRPHTKQREWLALDCMEALYGGAAGGGKSDALLMAYFGDDDDPKRWVKQSGYAGLILRRTYKDLALEGAIMDRSHKWLIGSDAKWSESDKRWTFPSGATLTFGYLDGPRDHLRYQSAEFQYIAFDELTQFHEHQYRYLFSRLRRRAGIAAPLRMRSATNPGGVGHKWVKQRFLSDPKERVFVPATLDDNPGIDATAYRMALIELDNVTRKQLESGEWIEDSSGLVYSGFDQINNIVIALPEPPQGKRWLHGLGIDYGNVDATALCVQAFNDEISPIVYTVESQKWGDLDPDDAAEIVKAWNERYRFDFMVGDVGGLGKGYAEQARRRWGLPIEPADKVNKLGYIKLMNGAYQHKRKMIVRDTNPELITELSELIWKDERRLEEHPSFANHCTDSDLYGWRKTTGYAYMKPQDLPDKTSAAYHEQRRQEHIKRLEREMRQQAVGGYEYDAD